MVHAPGINPQRGDVEGKANTRRTSENERSNKRTNELTKQNQENI